MREQITMSPDEFMSGEYPEVKMRKRIQEFRALLRNAESPKLIKKEFERLFPEDK
jgi:hypothetical protein